MGEGRQHSHGVADDKLGVRRYLVRSGCTTNIYFVLWNAGEVFVPKIPLLPKKYHNKQFFNYMNKFQNQHKSAIQQLVKLVVIYSVYYDNIVINDIKKQMYVLNKFTFVVYFLYWFISVGMVVILELIVHLQPKPPFKGSLVSLCKQ